MKKYLATLFSTFVVIILLFSSSHAVPVTFEFNGTIRNLQGEPSNIPKNNSLSPGDKFWGEYTFESSATMTDGHVGIPIGPYGGIYDEAIYHGAVSNISFSTNGYRAEANGGGFDIMTINRVIDGEPQKVSTYQMSASPYMSGNSWEFDNNFQISADSLYGFNIKSIALNLYINSYVLETVSLPSTPPDISLFEQKEIYLNYYHDGIDLGATGIIESLTIKDQNVPVPEPSTFILLFLGILVLFHYKRKSSQN